MFAGQAIGRGLLLDQVSPGDQRLPAAPDGAQVNTEAGSKFAQGMAARTHPEEVVLPAVGILGTDEAVEQQRAVAAPARAAEARFELAEDCPWLNDFPSGGRLHSAPPHRSICG